MENDLSEVSMQIILNAGNARENMQRAVSALTRDDLKQYKEEMDLAKENMRLAHVAQTKLIQQEASGEREDVSLLFIHAQDTLMTIMSEYHLLGYIYQLLKRKENPYE